MGDSSNVVGVIAAVTITSTILPLLSLYMSGTDDRNR